MSFAFTVDRKVARNIYSVYTYEPVIVNKSMLFAIKNLLYIPPYSPIIYTPIMAACLPSLLIFLLSVGR
jgi:hypothetical protein